MQTIQDSQQRTSPTATKIGIGWRPQLALAIERRNDLGFIEVTAEDFCNALTIPRPLLKLMDAGTEILLHSTALSLGGAGLPTEQTLDKIARLAEKTGASLVSDHIAFVRSHQYDSGHLLPVERSTDMLEVMVANVNFAKERLNVPFALENIAALFEWPYPEMTEAQFVSELITRSNSSLLLDVSNLYANSQNHKFDAIEYLKQLPLDRLAYVHVAGGRYADGLYHDTHSDPVPKGAVELLRELTKLSYVPRVMVEIDDRFPNENELNTLLDEISQAVAS